MKCWTCSNGSTYRRLRGETLLELIAESTDYENVNNAQVDEVPDVEGAAVGGDDVETIKVWSNFHFSFSIILCLVQKK